MKILSFNGFEGSADIDLERNVCRGKLLFIPDLITYEASSPLLLHAAFEEAVTDYLETCKTLGRNPHKPFRGSFNVRVEPDLHRAASVRAASDDVSLNDIVVRALDCYLHSHAEVHNVTIRVDHLTTFTSGSGSPQVWQPISASSPANVRH